ncbi:hypothetical protein TNCV_4615671 [Trichonephila clavipes]|nr:hypothetical protein TNCV_4615671 [Trichonephila clavipes]
MRSSRQHFCTTCYSSSIVVVEVLQTVQHGSSIVDLTKVERKAVIRFLFTTGYSDGGDGKYPGQVSNLRQTKSESLPLFPPLSRSAMKLSCRERMICYTSTTTREDK